MNNVRGCCRTPALDVGRF